MRSRRSPLKFLKEYITELHSGILVIKILTYIQNYLRIFNTTRIILY